MGTTMDNQLDGQSDGQSNRPGRMAVMEDGYDAEAAGTPAARSKFLARRAAWFGGRHVEVGERTMPPLPHLAHVAIPDVSSEDVSAGEKESEPRSSIQYKTCSWQKTAALLFAEYICLAIMSFPWSYSILGLVPGLILTCVQAVVVLYTSLVLWDFCLRHPEVRDVCDIGQMLFGGKKWAWWATAAMFLLNNTFIQALHILIAAKYLNTVFGLDSVVGCQTVAFGLIATVLFWLCSLLRTFKALSRIGTATAFFTFVSVTLATVFAVVQPHPTGFRPQDGEPIVTAFPQPGTTFVVGLSAFLNMAYTFIGQITLPSFIAEMEDSRDFPKALWSCTILELIVFCVVGAIMYLAIGTQYMTSPAFGSLDSRLYKVLSFSFMVPTLIFLGVLYASVSARFVFFRVFADSRHKSENTFKGWLSWGVILLCTWVAAFLIANVIPFFNSLLALMSSLFDSFFGFIFWGIAYFRMRRKDGRHVSLLADRTFRGWFEAILNLFIILTGCFFLTAGTYVSVEGILAEFSSGKLGSVFQCSANGL